MSKFCPICLQPHNERSDACADAGCRRRLRNFKASVRSGRTRALSRVRAAGKARDELAGAWRDLAMGRDPDGAVAKIFKLDGKKEVK